MTRSVLPGLAIATAVLIAGLLLAFTIGRYPVSLAELGNVLLAKLSGQRPDVPAAVEASFCRCAARAYLRPHWSALHWRWLAPHSRGFSVIHWCRRTSRCLLGEALGAVIGIFLSLGVLAI